jgi:hypothetical protein
MGRKKYALGHRAKKNALDRVAEVQRGQAGKNTTYQEAESANRKERRRFAKGARRFDKKHGEGAAEAGLRRGVELQEYEEAALKVKPKPADVLASKFVRRGD